MLSETNPPEISDTEVVAHYILSTSEYSVSRQQVKGRALEPSKKDQTTSVFRINGLQDSDIWRLGHTYVNIPQGQSLRARADINVASIRAVNLGIRAEEPPPRHAVIFDWPTAKEALMAVAQELAADATLKLAP